VLVIYDVYDGVSFSRKLTYDNSYNLILIKNTLISFISCEFSLFYMYKGKKNVLFSFFFELMKYEIIGFKNNKM